MEQQAQTDQADYQAMQAILEQAQAKFGIEPAGRMRDIPDWARQPLSMAQIQALAELGDALYQAELDPYPSHVGLMLAKLATMPGLPVNAAGYLIATAAGCFALELREIEEARAYAEVNGLPVPPDLVNEGRSPTGTLALIRLIRDAIERIDAGLATIDQVETTVTSPDDGADGMPSWMPLPDGSHSLSNLRPGVKINLFGSRENGFTCRLERDLSSIVEEGRYVVDRHFLTFEEAADWGVGYATECDLFDGMAGRPADAAKGS